MSANKESNSLYTNTNIYDELWQINFLESYKSREDAIILLANFWIDSIWNGLLQTFLFSSEITYKYTLTPHIQILNQLYALREQMVPLMMELVEWPYIRNPLPKLDNQQRHALLSLAEKQIARAQIAAERLKPIGSELSNEINMENLTAHAEMAQLSIHIMLENRPHMNEWATHLQEQMQERLSSIDAADPSNTINEILALHREYQYAQYTQMMKYAHALSSKRAGSPSQEGLNGICRMGARVNQILELSDCSLK